MIAAMLGILASFAQRDPMAFLAALTGFFGGFVALATAGVGSMLLAIHDRMASIDDLLKDHVLVERQAKSGDRDVSKQDDLVFKTRRAVWAGRKFVFSEYKDGTAGIQARDGTFYRFSSVEELMSWIPKCADRL